MKDEKKKRGPTAPLVPTTEVPDPSVPNRAHTEMLLGNFDANKGGQARNSLGNFDPQDKK